jgi:hypothetical protein
MFERFNNNFQNTVTEPNTDFNPYQNQYFGQNDQTTPYIQGDNMAVPKPMPGNLTEQNLYPLESSLATPYLNTPVGAPYKHGGKVKSQKTNPYPSLAEMIRQQGKGEDTILAHINPLEAEILKGLGGKGTINPKTGLPQFGFFKNPFKAIKSVFGGGAGAIIGNMIAPGIGGIIGGALGQGVQNKARGKNFLQGALKGAGMGAALPSAASALGWGAGKLGANSLASSLTNYGNTNAILPALGLGGENGAGSMLGKGSGLATAMSLGGRKGQVPVAYSGLGVGAGSDGATADDLPFMDKLIGKSKNYLSDPANLLTLGVVGSSFMNRPKKETPEKRARDEKAYQKGLMLTSEELQQKEAQDLALAQMKRRVERNKFLPEERFAIDPLYVKSNTPEEYRKSGRWLNYYNNPDFSGEPLVMKKGGQAKTNGFFEIEEMEYPSGLGRYIAGETKGQDDKIPAVLSDGEFVIPADVVADLGDGNNDAGAKELYKFMSNIRKHKRGGKVDLPPKAKSLSSYLKGKPKLATSDRSLVNYMRGN